jgi:hypothetical protein
MAMTSLGVTTQTEMILFVSHCLRKPRQGQPLWLFYCHKTVHKSIFAFASLANQTQTGTILFVAHCPRKPRQGQPLLLFYCHKTSHTSNSGCSCLSFLGRHDASRSNLICVALSKEAKARTATVTVLLSQNCPQEQQWLSLPWPPWVTWTK